MAKTKKNVSDIEIWEKIKGYEGHYEISNFGQLRALKG